jgi:predicted GIY-YIG superfamily endonuclease
MPNYQNGKIYKLVNSENEIIYIGSTTVTLAQRMRGHRSSAKTSSRGILYNAMREIGIEKFRIIFIENFPCDTVSELESREYEIMNDYKKDEIELYNLTTEKGKIHESTREKMRARIDSVETIKKRSAALFKRGCVSFSENQWRFYWHEDGKRKSKSFSIKKYGDKTTAYRKAVKYQDKIYPIESESDSD